MKKLILIILILFAGCIKKQPELKWDAIDDYAYGYIDCKVAHLEFIAIDVESDTVLLRHKFDIEGGLFAKKLPEVDSYYYTIDIKVDGVE